MNKRNIPTHVGKCSFVFHHKKVSYCYTSLNSYTVVSCSSTSLNCYTLVSYGYTSLNCYTLGTIEQTNACNGCKRVTSKNKMPVNRCGLPRTESQDPWGPRMGSSHIEKSFSQGARD